MSVVHRGADILPAEEMGFVLDTVLNGEKGNGSCDVHPTNSSNSYPLVSVLENTLQAHV